MDMEGEGEGGRGEGRERKSRGGGGKGLIVIVGITLLVGVGGEGGTWGQRLKKAVIAPNVDTKKVSRLQTKDVKNNLAEEDEEMEVKESGRTDSRIIGGSGAYYGEFPFAALLEVRDLPGGYSQCGGSAITTSAVLTAAHCVQEVRRAPGRVVVRMGSHRTSTQDSHQENIRTRRILVHPNYKLTATRVENDIALLQLERPFKRNSYKGIIKRYTNVNIRDSRTHLQVLGWGVVREDGPTADSLYKATVPVIPQAECLGLAPPPHPGILCAGWLKGGVDACQGDSGGPLVQRRGGKYMLVGITSYGYGCARPGTPGFYTNVAAYRSWIDRGLASLGPGRPGGGAIVFPDSTTTTEDPSSEATTGPPVGAGSYWDLDALIN